MFKQFSAFSYLRTLTLLKRDKQVQTVCDNNLVISLFFKCTNFLHRPDEEIIQVQAVGVPGIFLR